AEFGVPPDLLTEPDDLRAASIDRLPHPPLQLVLRHGRPSVQKPLDILLPRDGLRRHTVSMDYHHVLEAAGVVVFGLVFYSYTFRWFHPKGRSLASSGSWSRWRRPRWCASGRGVRDASAPTTPSSWAPPCSSSPSSRSCSWARGGSSSSCRWRCRSW